MKPLSRLNNISLFITTGIVIWIISSFDLTILDTYFEIVLGATAVTGAYNIIFFLTKMIFQNNRLIKRIIFGKYYFEGIWVGCYFRKEEKIFYVEYFEQTLDSLIITGRSYSNTEEKIECTWYTGKVSVDMESRNISYNYTVDSKNEKGLNIGQARFAIIKCRTGEIPKLMIGYTCSLHKKKKKRSFEKKISYKKLKKEKIDINNITREELENLVEN